MAGLLAKSSLLFGAPGVVPNRLPERPPEIVLGWLAHAYDQRTHLNCPAALAYARLLTGAMPPQACLDHPEWYLPASFLAEIGWISPKCADTAAYRSPDPTEEDEGQVDEEEAPEADSPNPSLLVQVNGHSILEAWEQVAQQLQQDIAPPTWQAYLSEAAPLRWEPPGRLVIGVPTEHCRDWLASRLTSTLSHLLVGILAQPVTVLFECDT